MTGSCVGVRPLNSALEVDLDFEHAVRPPPQPSEEQTASLEDLIRERIANQQWDDPPRPPAAVVAEHKKPELELDDKKSKKVCCQASSSECVSDHCHD